MCFSLLKNYKIPIFNAAIAIKTILSVKQFLRNFVIALSKCPFLIIKPITEFVFRFPNVGDFTKTLYFNRQRTFSESQVKGPFGILKLSWQAFVVKVVAVLIESQIKHIFFLKWFTSATPVKFG